MDSARSTDGCRDSTEAVSPPGRRSRLAPSIGSMNSAARCPYALASRVGRVPSRSSGLRRDRSLRRAGSPAPNLLSETRESLIHADRLAEPQLLVRLAHPADELR